MKMDDRIKDIIQEELTRAWDQIIKRIESLPDNNDNNGFISLPVLSPAGGSHDTQSGPVAKRALPEQFEEKYLAALKIYKEEINHSRVARELGVSISSAKKYYARLVNCGYLPQEEKELTDKEKEIVECIYVKKMSLAETARKLDCSITNVVRRRDSALSKGYIPPVDNFA